MTPHPDEGTLHAYIDGELSAGEATALAAHVAECGQCGAALAEARGLVTGASRAISALDAAPLSATRPIVARPEALPALRPSSRPFVSRIPFARAAALLLLAGGSAVVINRSTSDDGPTSSAESPTADVALTEERASAAPPVMAAPNAAANPASAATLASPTVGRDLSARGAIGGVGAVSQKEGVTPAAPTAPAPMAARIASGGNAATDQEPRPREANAPPAVEMQTGRVAGSTAAATPIQAPARMAGSEEFSLSSATRAARVTRYRTKDGVMLILSEEPLRTAFAQDSTARRRVVRPMAQSATPVVNTYRWSSLEQEKSFTLTGALSVVELEAVSKRLSELERVP